MSGRSVVGRHARAAQQGGALGAGAVAKPEQHSHLGGPLGLQRILQDRQRSDADAPAHQQRAPAALGRLKPLPERSERPQAIALAQLAQAPRARSDVLEQEMGLPDAAPGDREGARQVGTLVLSPAPALGAGEHRELPRLRIGAVHVGDAQHPVGAELIHAEDRQQPGRERRGRRGPLAHVVRTPCSSCRHSTSGSPPRRALAIARAADPPADSVVRQGMPCITAARRIS